MSMESEETKTRSRDSFWRGLVQSLSARLLILTISFVMLTEVFVFLPSVANFRMNWLNEKLGAGHLAILALDATPDGMVSEQLQMELLKHVGARSIAVRRIGVKVALINDMPPKVDVTYDLRDAMAPTLIMDALNTLFETEEKVMRVVGRSPKDNDAEIDLILNEAPLQAAMVDFAKRIFLLSLAISLVTAGLVYLSLQWFLVRPMRRLTANMVGFADKPEDESRIIKPGQRRDEVGRAQRELAGLQRGLHGMLRQKAHLAALGTAVAKINHDLKGILSTALVVSDALENSEDPQVKKISPTLISAIDRAVALCGQTLNYVGQDRPPLDRTEFNLASLIEEVGEGLPNGAQLVNDADPDIILHADRDQMFRVFSNLSRNAAQAGAEHIHVTQLNGQSSDIKLQILDDGPGLPPRAQKNLFKAFEGSGRSGGTGLGLAIARELMRAHGGDLTLSRTGAEGTAFHLDLPGKS